MQNNEKYFVICLVDYEKPTIRSYTNKDKALIFFDHAQTFSFPLLIKGELIKGDGLYEITDGDKE